MERWWPSTVCFCVSCTYLMDNMVWRRRIGEHEHEMKEKRGNMEDHRCVQTDRQTSLVAALWLRKGVYATSWWLMMWIGVLRLGGTTGDFDRWENGHRTEEFVCRLASECESFFFSRHRRFSRAPISWPPPSWWTCHMLIKWLARERGRGGECSERIASYARAGRGRKHREIRVARHYYRVFFLSFSSNS